MINKPIKFEKVKKELISDPKIWVITGVAGFIGSNLLETLLKLNQTVRGLDNFSTGFQENLDDVKNCVSKNQWDNFLFVEVLNSQSEEKREKHLKFRQ